VVRWLTLVCALLATGCNGRGCARSETGAIPSDVDVLVEREGKPSMHVDAALLSRCSPDFVEGDWRAWKLAKLVPEWETNAVVDLEDDEGFRATLIRPGESAAAMEPVLLVGPSGETRVIGLAPGHPITAHQGAARKDSGRVRHIRRVRCRSLEGALSDPVTAGAPTISLRVLIDDAPQTWTRNELGRVKPIVLMSKDGDGEREAWLLHDLAATLVGPEATVLAAVGEGDHVLQIDPAKWNDRALVPVLRANRRGRLKLVWLTRELEESGNEQLRAVTEVRIRR
jgi:hypothetical protein